jgi:hypothetical protein
MNRHPTINLEGLAFEVVVAAGFVAAALGGLG